MKKKRNAATEPLMLGGRTPGLRLMQLKTAKILGRGSIRRTAKAVRSSLDFHKGAQNPIPGDDEQDQRGGRKEVQQNSPVGRIIRTIGIARAKAKIGLQNLAYNMRRLVTLERMSSRSEHGDPWCECREADLKHLAGSSSP